MNYEILMHYIRPELIVVSIVLYIIGVTLKNTKYINDELIPWILGILSIIICMVYLLAVSDTPKNYHESLILTFDIVIQGILCAAASVYINQLYKQYNKIVDKDNEVSEETEDTEDTAPKEG